MYEHSFYSLCPKGHKRNFVWNDEKVDKFLEVNEYCIYCEAYVNFVVKRYWEEPKLLPPLD